MLPFGSLYSSTGNNSLTLNKIDESPAAAGECMNSISISSHEKPTTKNSRMFMATLQCYLSMAKSWPGQVHKGRHEQGRQKGL